MGRKLLVADDSVTIQKVIKLALSSEGYDILAVSDGKEAIRAIQEERPDVVLIDVALAGADAYEVKRAINQNSALAKVGFILMASAFERVDEKAIDELRFQARLIKPFDPSHLRKAVAELMGKTPSGPAATPTIEKSTDTALGSTPPAMPPEPPIEPSGEDLPPMRDMHPTVTEQTPAPIVTEEEFQIDASEPTRRLEMPAKPAREERTDPSFTLPEGAVPPTPPPPPPSLPEERTNSQINIAARPPLAPEPEASEEEEAEQQEIAATRTLENDIKNLTESTIKMSGLDDFQWNLDDSRKMKGGAPATTIAPPAPAAPAESTREVPRPSTDKKVAAIKTLMSPPAKQIDDGGSNFPMPSGKPDTGARKPEAPMPTMAPPIQQPPAHKPPPDSNLVSGRDYVPPTIELKREATNPSLTAPTGASPMSRAEMEQLIRKELHETLERMLRDVVPQIAEAVIRKEIEKILAEP